MSKNKLKVLVYDIETTPLKAYIWRPGEQVIRHAQLDKDFYNYKIICIAYAWNDGKPAKVLGFDYEDQDSSTIIAIFDQIIEQADVVIGKNNTKFDNKHLNMQRMLAGQKGIPDWTYKSDDLEAHMRKTFALPSNSLDYISKLLGLGGKTKMEFQDWIDIVEKNDNGKKAYDKMLKYCRKDVEDTRAVLEYCQQHFIMKHSAAAKQNLKLACDSCGSTNLIKNGTRMKGRTLYQRFHCNEHNGFACYVLESQVDKLYQKEIISGGPT